VSELLQALAGALLVTLTAAPVYQAWVAAGRPTLEEL
jgi:hypothetical protein